MCTSGPSLGGSIGQGSNAYRFGDGALVNEQAPRVRRLFAVDADLAFINSGPGAAERTGLIL